MKQSLTAPLALTLGLTVALAAVVPEHSRADSGPPPAPIFSALKTYRNYFTIGKTTPLAQRFDVWFLDVDYNHMEIAGNSAQEILALSPSEITGEWGGIAIPPTSVPAVPAELAPLADAVRQKILQLNPNARNIQIIYNGRFATVALKEMIPASANPDPEKREAIAGEYTFRYDETMSSLALYGVGFTGLELLCESFQPANCATEPDFVDFSPSAGNLGRSLFGRESQDPASVSSDWQAFTQAVFAAIRTKAAGTYRNPIEDLLAAQGPAALPGNFHQTLALNVSVYGRTHDFSHQLDKELKLLIPVDQAALGPVTVTQQIPELQLTVSAEVSLKDLTAQLSFTPATGAPKVLSYTVSPDALIRDGDRLALTPMPELKPVGTPLSASNGMPGVSFPAVGSYTGIDAYLQGTWAD